MTKIKGIELDNYLGTSISDVFLQSGAVDSHDKSASQLLVSIYKGVSVEKSDLTGISSLEEIYANICVRLGIPTSTYAAEDSEI